QPAAAALHGMASAATSFAPEQFLAGFGVARNLALNSGRGQRSHERHHLPDLIFGQVCGGHPTRWNPLLDCSVDHLVVSRMPVHLLAQVWPAAALSLASVAGCASVGEQNMARFNRFGIADELLLLFA